MRLALFPNLGANDGGLASTEPLRPQRVKLKRSNVWKASALAELAYSGIGDAQDAGEHRGRTREIDGFFSVHVRQFTLLHDICEVPYSINLA